MSCLLQRGKIKRWTSLWNTVSISLVWIRGKCSSFFCTFYSLVSKITNLSYFPLCDQLQEHHCWIWRMDKTTSITNTTQPHSAGELPISGVRIHWQLIASPIYMLCWELVLMPFVIRSVNLSMWCTHIILAFKILKRLNFLLEESANSFPTLFLEIGHFFRHLFSSHYMTLYLFLCIGWEHHACSKGVCLSPG